MTFAHCFRHGWFLSPTSHPSVLWAVRDQAALWLVLDPQAALGLCRHSGEARVPTLALPSPGLGPAPPPDHLDVGSISDIPLVKAEGGGAPVSEAHSPKPPRARRAGAAAFAWAGFQPFDGMLGGNEQILRLPSFHRVPDLST